jgi:hypothetical protein
MGSLFNFLNSPKKSGINNRQNEPMDEICYSIQISFDTNGQIRYLDENERTRIVEFVGNSWSKSLLQSSSNKTSISIFLYNSYYKKDQVVTLTKKLNGDILDQRTFFVSGENTFEGWFKLDQQ